MAKSEVVEQEDATAEGSAEVEPVDVFDEPGMALAIREERGIARPPAASLPSEREWKATIAVATEISKTKFVPEAYRGEPESVVAAILTGREMGIGPMQSLRDINMIDGRPAFAASLMLSQMRKGGLVILDSEQNDERAWIRAQRKDTGEIAEVEWRYEEATKILRRGKPLSEGDNWKNYRGDMLWARCVGRLARRLGSDLLGGMVYSAEELRDLDSFEGDYDATTAPPDVTYEDIDPGETLHPNAPRDWKQIDLVLKALDPTRDWSWIVKTILIGKYQVEKVSMLAQQTAHPNAPQVAGRRFANWAGYLADVIMEGKEFPPPSDEDVLAATAWAFERFSFEFPAPDPSDAALATEEIEEAEFVAVPEGQQFVEADEIDFGPQEEEK